MNECTTLVALFRNMWFLCVLFSFTLVEENEATGSAMEWQKPALALEEPHDSVSSDVQYNSARICQMPPFTGNWYVFWQCISSQGIQISLLQSFCRFPKAWHDSFSGFRALSSEELLVSYLSFSSLTHYFLRFFTTYLAPKCSHCNPGVLPFHVSP